MGGLVSGGKESPATERTPLPPGHSFVRDGEISARNQAKLFNAVGWPITSTEILFGRRFDALNGKSRIDIGVLDPTGDLVGFGTVTYIDDQGELSDFAVNPHDRGQGIGKAIVDERLRLAEEAGVDSFYMPYLMATNTLRSFYYERGFHETERGEVVRGPNPAPLGRPH